MKRGIIEVGRPVCLSRRDGPKMAFHRRRGPHPSPLHIETRTIDPRRPNQITRLTDRRARNDLHARTTSPPCSQTTTVSRLRPKGPCLAAASSLNRVLQNDKQELTGPHPAQPEQTDKPASPAPHPYHPSSALAPDPAPLSLSPPPHPTPAPKSRYSAHTANCTPS